MLAHENIPRRIQNRFVPKKCWLLCWAGGGGGKAASNAKQIQIQIQVQGEGEAENTHKPNYL